MLVKLPPRHVELARRGEATAPERHTAREPDAPNEGIAEVMAATKPSFENSRLVMATPYCAEEKPLRRYGYAWIIPQSSPPHQQWGKLEFHDFSFPLGSPRRSLRTRGFNSRVRHHPCTIQSGPDSLPSDYDGAIRRRVAGAPARSRHSSLRSHAENKPPSSAIPLGKTSGCRPSASHACKLSFLTRRTPAPCLKTPDANGCENAVRFSV